MPFSRTRPYAAALIGIAFVIAYVAVAITLPDLLPNQWAVQAIYFLIAGIAWVIPVRWLMLWSVGKR
jgi:hypothetical protein